jgi:GTPase
MFKTGQVVHVVHMDENFIPCVKTGTIRCMVGGGTKWWVAGIYGDGSSVADIDEERLHPDMETALQKCREIIEAKIEQYQQRLTTIKAMQGRHR